MTREKKYPKLYYALGKGMEAWDSKPQQELHNLTWTQAVQKIKSIANESGMAVRLSETKGYNNQGHYFAPQAAKGDKIPNNYQGRTTGDIWASWDKEQKTHFLIDHFGWMGQSEINKTLNKKYSELPSEIKSTLTMHTKTTQYAKGKKIKNVWEEYDFDSIEEFFDYIIGSKINGNLSQVKSLYNKLDDNQKKDFFTYTENISDSAGEETVDYINKNVRKFDTGAKITGENFKLNITDYDVTVYEDDYNEGQGKQINSNNVKVNKSFNNGKDLLKYIMDHIIYSTVDNNDFSAFEDGRIVVSTLVDENNTPASTGQIERWKKGELMLYIADHDIYVTLIDERIPTTAELSELIGIPEYKKGGVVKTTKVKQTKRGKYNDSKFKAMKAGKHISKDGNVYYEYRSNRTDLDGRKKLAKGDMIGSDRFGWYKQISLQDALDKFSGYYFISPPYALYNYNEADKAIMDWLVKEESHLGKDLIAASWSRDGEITILTAKDKYKVIDASEEDYDNFYESFRDAYEEENDEYVAAKGTKAKDKKYSDKFEEVLDLGSESYFIRDFGHVETDKKGKVDLVAVATILDLEDYVSKDELPKEGNFQLSVTLVPYSKFISKKMKEKANDDNSSIGGSDEINIVNYMGGLNYQPNDKVFFKTDADAKKYLYSKEFNDKISAEGMLSGFTLDKAYNRLGQTNWEYLAYMTGESEKFAGGGYMKKYAKGTKVSSGKSSQIKFYDIPNHIKHLEFDGDKTDLRLHSQENFNWGADNESEYKKAQKEIDAIEYKGKGWTIYAWYDVSSYNYWMKQVQEKNYIQLTVAFDKDTVDESEIEKIANALDKALADADAIAFKYSYDPYNDDEDSTAKRGTKVKAKKSKRDKTKQSKQGLKEDKSRKALHAGKRTSAAGNVYYEFRKNHSDKNRTKKLAKGNVIDSNKRLDAMTNGYLASVLFTSSENDEYGTPLDSNYSISDFAPEVVEKVRENLKRYISENAIVIKKSGLTDDQIGIDIWFAQSHQGAGFFDRDLDEAVEKKLTDAALKFNQDRNGVVGDDGKVYIE